MTSPAPSTTRQQMQKMPIVRQSISARVLTHGRDKDAVGKFNIANRERIEQMSHEFTLPLSSVSAGTIVLITVGGSRAPDSRVKSDSAETEISTYGRQTLEILSKRSAALAKCAHGDVHGRRGRRDHRVQGRWVQWQPDFQNYQAPARGGAHRHQSNERLSTHARLRRWRRVCAVGRRRRHDPADHSAAWVPPPGSRCDLVIESLHTSEGRSSGAGEAICEFT